MGTQTTKSVTAVNIRDRSLLREVSRVQRVRGDGNASKTFQDLVRERLAELRSNGDPHAVEHRGSSAA